MPGAPGSPAQPVWRIELIVPAASFAAFQSVLDPFAEAVSIFEVEGGKAWRIAGYAEAEPDRAALEVAATIAASAAGTGAPAIRIERLGARDWVAENRLLLQPVRAGAFFVAPTHYDGPVPEDAITIVLDAGPAFGAGTHETTRGCLEAITRLAAQDGFAPERLLDLGCGSGILAIAMAKRWGKPVRAIDHDPMAVETARENAARNGVGDLVEAAEGDALLRETLVGDMEGGEGAWDLIAANILAGPLIAMASDLAAALAPGGAVILSGLLTDQAAEVQAAYEAAGLALADMITLGEWPTLIMRRG
jgi:ribosomal protein L11 methyltransferase